MAVQTPVDPQQQPAPSTLASLTTPSPTQQYNLPMVLPPHLRMNKTHIGATSHVTTVIPVQSLRLRYSARRIKSVRERVTTLSSFIRRIISVLTRVC
jgi:hypothetical protein